MHQTELLTVTATSAKQPHHNPEVIKCKICHGEASEDKPIQCFCNCKDKRAHTHAFCLQSYLENKLNKSLEIDLDP